MNAFYRQGEKAREIGLDIDSCPYDMPPRMGTANNYPKEWAKMVQNVHYWLAGWNDKDMEIIKNENRPSAVGTKPVAID